ncbi:TetR/AcrR family transcriptional regulator [Humibacter albus]|uniref:TetR/AcrR family transcriptional regulator n=1 Tax=Humibacter albus TaxID=427754 RepID=UPI000A0704CD|nr:TetR/AcrR family transcriptional regulator [Humibacter albus]
MTESTTSSPQRRRNPRGQGTVLRDQLVEAAARLLATMDRPETLTLRRLAREVGVAPASIYSHFPDLDSLVTHVLQLRFAELASAMRRAAEDAPDALHDLVARCGAYVRWGVQHPGEYRTIVGGGMPAAVAPLSMTGVGEELLGTVSNSLAAVAPAGPAREWFAAIMLWTALHGVVSLYNEHGAIRWPPLDDLIIDVLRLHTGRSAAELGAALEPIDPPRDRGSI